MIGFVILTKNNPDFLKTCLTHLAVQTVQDWRAIVIDTSSENILKKNKQIIDSFGVNIEHYEYCLNSGYAEKNNLGISELLEDQKIDFICLLNDGAFLSSTFIEKVLSYAEKLSDASAFSPLFIYDKQRNKIQVAGGGYFSDDGRCGENQILHDCIMIEKPIPIDFGYGAAIVYKREVFEKCGLLDINFKHGFDEPDMAKRMKLAGMQIFYIPVRVYHVYGGSSNKLKWWQNLHAILPMTYGRLYFLLKHYPIEVAVGDELHRIKSLLFKPKQILLELYSLVWNSFHAQDTRANYHELYDPPEPTKAEKLLAREQKRKIIIPKPPFKYRFAETLFVYSFAIGLLIIWFILFMVVK